MAYSPLALQAINNDHKQNTKSRFRDLDHETKARVKKARHRRKEELARERKVTKAKFKARILSTTPFGKKKRVQGK